MPSVREKLIIAPERKDLKEEAEGPSGDKNGISTEDCSAFDDVVSDLDIHDRDSSIIDDGHSAGPLDQYAEKFLKISSPIPERLPLIL